MRKIILTESQSEALAKKLNEEMTVQQMPVDKKMNKPYCIDPEKVRVVKKFLDDGIELIFLKEPHINTAVYKEAAEKQIGTVQTGDDATDELMKAIAKGESVNPMLFFSASLFILSCAIVFLRVIPLLSSFIFPLTSGGVSEVSTLCTTTLIRMEAESPLSLVEAVTMAYPVPTAQMLSPDSLIMDGLLVVQFKS